MKEHICSSNTYLRRDFVADLVAPDGWEFEAASLSGGREAAESLWSKLKIALNESLPEDRDLYLKLTEKEAIALAGSANNCLAGSLPERQLEFIDYWSSQNG